MKKVILAIIDGFGENKNSYGNAYLESSHPALDFIYENYSHSLLEASGEFVGLPKGQMGNSEVGHITIGSGRVVEGPLLKIDKEIASGEFFNNEAFIEAFEHAKKYNSKVHIMGLLSDGGIHSSINHIMALIDMAKQYDVDKLYLHAFLDGRDTAYNVCLKYLDGITNFMKELNIGSLATVSGRYYAMDREKDYTRTKLAYDVIVNNFGPYEEDYKKVIEDNYKRENFDEFINPTIIDKKGVVENDDSIIVANFRPDRLTQLFSAITNPRFRHFETKKLNNLKVVTMMSVDKSIKCINAYPHHDVLNTFGEVIENNKLKSLRIAETSKYPHVNHFFDGDKDIVLKNTTRKEIKKKDVRTYDLYPPMSSKEVTDYIVKHGKKYDFILVNYANLDMVGHTGNFEACKNAVSYVDMCIRRLHEFAGLNNYTLFITADHGNCEEMLDSNGNILTTHTTNPVRFVICNKSYQVYNGSLKDIAPSILNYMGLPVPEEMTGFNIISKK